MKRLTARSVVAFSLCLSTLLVADSVADAAKVHAHSHATTTTTLTTTTQAGSPSPTNNPWKTYRQELAAYLSARRQIAQNFRNAVAAAQAQFAAARSSSTTGAELATARATYALAIAQAAQVRSAALMSLGNPPTAP